MEIKEINNWFVIETETTKSTNDDALVFTLSKIGDKKFIFCTKRQTCGRGRLGRSWSDGEGNLMFSAIVTCTNENAGRLALISGISVLETIKSYKSSADLSLKWPNDVLLENKKVCGILIERKDEINLVVGIGVNIKNSPILNGCSYQATNLSECGIITTREEFLCRFLEIFNVWLEKIEKKEFNAIQQAWIKNAKSINQMVEIENIKEKIAGKLLGINEKGALVLEKNGKQIAVLSGDVHYL